MDVLTEEVHGSIKLLSLNREISGVVAKEMARLRG
jgi:hypothetical protein